MTTVSLLANYRKKKKLQCEVLRKDIIVKIHEAVSELEKTVHFKDAYIFGSVLTPYFSEDSDIDIAFTGLKNNDFFRAMRLVSEFTGRDIDIIQLESHRLKDKIMKEGVKIKQ